MFRLAFVYFALVCLQAGAFEPIADLPPVLRFNDGRPVVNTKQWVARRAEILKLMKDHFVGHPPQDVPKIIDVQRIGMLETQDGSKREHIRVTFATPNKASLSMWVWTPASHGPYPLLLVAPRYYQIGWAELALKRGYKVCLFPGVDSHHRESAYKGFDSQWSLFQKEYPKASWSEIVTKAWLAGRCLDYLLDQRFGHQVDAAKVGIIGHSRYGKAAMIAGAIDDRITCVVARSPGSPGNSPYRFTSRNTFNETPSDFPSRWFLPSLKSYRGREHELPFDAHGWMALIAPRACLVHVAHNDDSGPTYGDERAYREARKAYQLLGADDQVRLHYRAGGHDPITDMHREDNLNWFDLSFGRGTVKRADFPVRLIHDFDWNAWRRRSGEFRSPTRRKRTPKEVRAAINWMLGEQPSDMKWDGKYTFQSGANAKMRNHERWSVPGVKRLPVSFADNVHGNVYYRADLTQPAPVVIWLHPYSYPSGFNEAYGVEGTTIYYRLAQQGYIVLAYDQCGFGGRLLEGRDFYQEYPRWSRLGRMVFDVRGAVDFFIDGKGKAQGAMPKIDPKQINVLGYSLGAVVGLYAAARDNRVSTLGLFCGITPMRGEQSPRFPGNAGLYQWHGLLPRLGLYKGKEGEIPFDYDDLLQLVGSRRVLVYAPKRDRFADHHALAELLKNAGGSITVKTPDDENRFQSAQHAIYMKWLKQ